MDTESRKQIAASLILIVMAVFSFDTCVRLFSDVPPELRGSKAVALWILVCFLGGIPGERASMHCWSVCLAESSP